MINIERIKNTNQTIWRYMNLWKFESMLQDNGCLYFTRSDMFADKLEGKYSDITLKNLKEKYLELHGEIFVENWKRLYYSKNDYFMNNKDSEIYKDKIINNLLKDQKITYLCKYVQF